ncbi:protein of unknown function [Pseudomonas sp. JV551A1]|nr:protein of unknown function [Pseudomonas sp. JV551A1]
MGLCCCWQALRCYWRAASLGWTWPGQLGVVHRFAPDDGVFTGFAVGAAHNSLNEQGLCGSGFSREHRRSRCHAPRWILRG